DLVQVRLGRALLHPGGLFDQDRRGRGLHDEGEALVGIGRDHHRNRQTGLHALRLGVERLAEFHDVQAALTERRTDGGRGVGLTSRHLQLDKADDFLRHALLLAGSSARPRGPGSPGLMSGLFDLAEIELDGRGTTENRDRDAHLALLVIDVLDVAVEVGEGALFDADHFAHFEQHLWTRFFHARLHLGEDLFHFLFGNGRGAVARATEEAGDAGGVLDQVPGFVGQLHLDQDVTRENAALADGLLAALDLDDLFGRHQDAAEGSLQAGTLDALDQGLVDAFFHAGIDMDHVPSLAHAAILSSSPAAGRTAPTL